MHTKEMPLEILLSLGFVREQDDYGQFSWKHKEDDRFIYFILTPEMVSRVLIDIGQRMGTKRISDLIKNLEID